jgi:hypothetical protein
MAPEPRAVLPLPEVVRTRTMVTVRTPGVLIYYLVCGCGCGCQADGQEHFGIGGPCDCRGQRCACVVDQLGESVLDPERGFGLHLAELAQAPRPQGGPTGPSPPAVLHLG